MRLGQVATVCAAPVSSRERIQPAIIEALQKPSARLPISEAKGAVLLYHGLEPLGGGQALRAYEAVSSLVGHDVEFVQLSARSTTVPGVSVFLTGYSYSMAIRTFVDLIEDLYDMEYGESSAAGEIGLPVRLYQMEGE
jgi:hypothetical protein